MHIKSGHVASEAHCAYFQRIDNLQQFRFERCNFGVGISFALFGKESSFCHKRTLLHCSAYSDAEYYRRAWLTSRFLYGFLYLLLYPFYTLCRCEHIESAHIFASEAFGKEGKGQSVSRNYSRMYYCRGVVTGIYAFEGRKYAASEVSVAVSVTHGVVYYLFKILSLKADFLSDIGKYYSHSRILTGGDIFFCGDIIAFDNCPERKFRSFTAFGTHSRRKRLHHSRLYVAYASSDDIIKRFVYKSGFNLSHTEPLLLL